jgi:hypothetical protein
MYIENKGGDQHTHWWGTTSSPASLTGPGRIGRVTFSKSGRSLTYRGKEFSKATEFKANYCCETGERFWISGPKKRVVMRFMPQTFQLRLMTMFAKSIGQRFAGSRNGSTRHGRFRSSISKMEIPFGNDKQEKQRQKQVLRSAQDDKVWGMQEEERWQTRSL